MNPPTSRHPSRAPWLVPALICLALSLATLAAFWEVRHFDFSGYDDVEYVGNNPMVRDGLSLGAIKWAFTTTYFSYWHPLTWMSHMLDCELFGLNPGPHHLTSLLIHIVNSVLMFLFLWRTTGAMWRSAFVSALFALHPLHVESVAWLAERKDVLSSMFWILTMWAYAWYAKRPSIRRYLWVLLLFILGLMSKPMLVTLPFVLLLLDYWPLGRLKLFGDSRTTDGSNPVDGSGRLAAPYPIQAVPLRRLILEKVPLLALALAVSALTFLTVSKEARMLSQEQLPLSFRFANVPISYVRYLGKMIVPEDMVFLYPIPAGWEAWQVVGASVLIVCLTLIVIALAQPRPYLPTGWFWFLGTLVPTIGLIPVGFQSIADRYTYIPLVGVFIMVTWAISDATVDWRPRRIALGIAAGLVIVGCMVGTRTQARYWWNDDALFSHAVSASTNNAVALYNLATTRGIQGRTEEALRHYREAVRIKPTMDRAQNNLGRMLLGAGLPDQASNHLAQALLTNPDNQSAHFNLATALLALNQPEPARAHFDQALQLNPNHAESHAGLARLLVSQQQFKDGMEHYREALRLKPDDPDALNALAWILATHPDPAIRNGAEALDLATRSCELTTWWEKRLFLPLAAAQAEMGRFDEAVATLERAQRLQETTSNPKLTATIERLVQLFQKQQPWREP